MIAKLLSWFNSAIDFVQKILWIIAIVGAGISFTSIKSCINQKKEKQQFITIAKNESQQRETISGNFAMEKQQWKIERRQLNQNITEKEAKNSVYLNELKEAKETIKDLQIREKNVQNYIKTELISKDSLQTNIIFEGNPCKFKLEPIEKEFLSLRFNQNDNYDLLDISYESRNTIYTILDIYPKRKQNGKKHFPNWGKIWGWDDRVITTVKDTNSVVTNIVSFNFTK